MPFLTQDDITDKVADRFKTDANTDLDYYLDLGDQYIISLAQAKSQGAGFTLDLRTGLILQNLEIILVFLVCPAILFLQ